MYQMILVNYSSQVKEALKAERKDHMEHINVSNVEKRDIWQRIVANQQYVSNVVNLDINKHNVQVL